MAYAGDSNPLPIALWRDAESKWVRVGSIFNLDRFPLLCVFSNPDRKFLPLCTPLRFRFELGTDECVNGVWDKARGGEISAVVEMVLNATLADRPVKCHIVNAKSEIKWDAEKGVSQIFRDAS